MSSNNKLGFWCCSKSPLIGDLEEYRELLPKLKPEDAAYLKQFLKEYYGKPKKDQLQIHPSEYYTKINEDAYAQKNDVTFQNANVAVKPVNKDKQAKYYSPSDYCKSPPTPLELYELQELLDDLQNKN